MFRRRVLAAREDFSFAHDLKILKIKNVFGLMTNKRLLLQKVFKAFGASKIVWRLGLKDEIRYWDSYIKSAGGIWGEEGKVEFKRLLSPDSELQPELAVLLGGKVEDARILDVGAGPLCFLGKTIGGRRLDITAVDPLAEEYAELFAKHGVSRPIETRLAEQRSWLTSFR